MEITEGLGTWSGNYLILNKAAVKKLGFDATAFLVYLLELEKNLKEFGDTYGSWTDGSRWFNVGIRVLEDDIGLSFYKQTKCISKLEEFGIVEQKNMGLPRRRYFRIKHENLDKFLKEVE